MASSSRYNPANRHLRFAQQGDSTRSFDGKAESARDEAIAHLHRLVDHQDDPCDFDHHGRCQAHFTDGSEPGKCGVAEARAWLAEHDTDERH